MSAFRTALVTGASSGIGRALARELAAGGCRVVVAARREAALAELAEEIRAAGGRADVQALDVRDPDAAAAAVRRWDAELDGLDLVVANAGVGVVENAAPMDWRAVREVLAVNVDGAVATLLAALPAMRARGRGTLAGVSSLAGVRGMPGSGAYSASKAALSTFLESLQLDLDGSGVRVVDVQPGFVRTPMTDVNTGPMPFLMDVGPAARIVLRGLERGRRVVAFPLPTTLAARLARQLPRGAWLWLGRRLGWSGTASSAADGAAGE